MSKVFFICFCLVVVLQALLVVSDYDVSFDSNAQFPIVFTQKPPPGEFKEEAGELVDRTELQKYAESLLGADWGTTVGTAYFPDEAITVADPENNPTAVTGEYYIGYKDLRWDASLNGNLSIREAFWVDIINSDGSFLDMNIKGTLSTSGEVTTSGGLWADNVYATNDLYVGGVPLSSTVAISWTGLHDFGAGVQMDDNLTVDGELVIKDGDADDYLIIKTAANQPEIQATGTNDIYFKTDQTNNDICMRLQGNGSGEANLYLMDGTTETDYGYLMVTDDLFGMNVAAGLSEIVINNASSDTNFRIESNNEDHLFWIDGGTDDIRMGDYDTNYVQISNAGAVTLAGTASITGDITGNASGSSGSCTGESATVATIAGLAPNTQNTYARTQYLIPYASTTTAFGEIAIGDDGQVLTSGGAGVAPTFEAVAGGGDWSNTSDNSTTGSLSIGQNLTINDVTFLMSDAVVVGATTCIGGLASLGQFDGTQAAVNDLSLDGALFVDSAYVTAILDEDDLGSDSATALATQRSVKKYVDDNAGGINNVVEDTSPQLGGFLDCNSFHISDVGGDVDIKDSLSVSDDVSVGGVLFVEKIEFILDVIDFVGDTQYDGTLSIADDLTVGGVIFGGDVIVGNMTNLTLSANAGALNAGDNVDFKLNPHSAVGKTLPWNDTSNSVTVEAGTYELGVCMRMGFGADDGECAYWWYNVTASQGIFPYSDTGSLKLSNSRLHNVPTIITTVTVTETTELEVRIKGESNLTAIVAQKSWAYIRRVK